jgi:hypothetical protein
MGLRECFDTLDPAAEGYSVKFANFFDEYDKHFANCRDKVRSVLEVGVQGGGSLSLWWKYFPNLKKVVGVDIFGACRCWARDGVAIYIGDASDREFMEGVCKTEGPFDVVIDDGSHMAEHQRRTFDIMFPHVNADGWYIIEDTQCSYWPRLGGGYKKDGVMELVKDLSDCVTWWAIEGQDLSRQSPSVAKYNGLIRAVHIHPASVFIEKGPERNHDMHYAFSDKASMAEWVKNHPAVYNV